MVQCKNQNIQETANRNKIIYLATENFYTQRY